MSFACRFIGRKRLLHARLAGDFGNWNIPPTVIARNSDVLVDPYMDDCGARFPARRFQRRSKLRWRGGRKRDGAEACAIGREVDRNQFTFEPVRGRVAVTKLVAK